MKSIVLPLLATTLSMPLRTAAQEAPAPRGCPLQPEVVAIQESCARGEEPADLCAWVPVVEDLLAGRREPAAAKLGSAFSLSGELATRILAVAGAYVLPLIGDSCSREELIALISSVLGSGPVQESLRRGGNASIAIHLRLMGFQSEALERVAPAMGELGQPAAARAVDAFIVFLQRSGVTEQLRIAMSGGNPMLTALSHSGTLKTTASGFSAELSEFAGPLAGIDAGLKLAGQGHLGEARKAIEAAVAEAPERIQGIALARAGWGYSQLFRLEDGLSMFARAWPLLEKAGSADPVSKYSLFMVAEGRSLTFSVLGIANQDAELDRLVNSEPLLRIFSGRLSAGSDPATMEQLLPKLLQSALSGEIPLSALEPFMLAVEATLPGMANFAPPEAKMSAAEPTDPLGLPFYQEVEQLLLGDAAAAEGILAETLKDNSHLGQLLGGFPVALAAWKQGDLETAKRAFIGLIELAERHLSEQRIDEVARSPYMDNLSSLLYFGAIELTGRTGEPLAAFQLAERGRAFTLRRLLGAPRSAEADLALSAEEKELVREIVRLGRGPAAEAARLPELYHRFETARLDRQLANARGTAPPFPVPASLATLQTEVLAEDETLLAFYPGLDGKLWSWRITTGEAEAKTLERPEDGFFRCLAQVLRWQETGDEPRRIAQARGAELLVSCPGQLAGVDPAVALYEKLIAPIEDHLQAGRRLILVPHGELHQVPFAALRNPKSGRRLAETYELAVEPSADALARLRRLHAGRPKTAVPYYWAGYTLVGDPEARLGNPTGR